MMAKRASNCFYRRASCMARTLLEKSGQNKASEGTIKTKQSFNGNSRKKSYSLRGGPVKWPKMKGLSARIDMLLIL